MKSIPRAVWILSLVSFFTDTASEMLYPVLPIYLKTIGFSVLLIGFLEGIAEATAGLSKGYFGKLSDQTGKRVPFVQFGYALSAISKPLMVAWAFPIWIFLCRTLDRLGKGVRTGARDAILSDEATLQTKGKIFGFHRSMDTLGAVAGPGLALLYLYFYPEDYTTLFLIAFIPGILAVVSSFILKDKKSTSLQKTSKGSFFSFLGYWKKSPSNYRKLMIGLLLFALFNSSDVFLLLQAKQAGLDDTAVIGIYIFYNLVYALFAFPLGILADRMGLKTMFMFGIGLFSLVYFGMAIGKSLSVFIALFFLYGIYAAATEGISKAWISNMVDKNDTATAIGTFAGFQSLCLMIASTLTGWVWYQWGAKEAFMLTGIVSLLVLGYLFFATKETEIELEKEKIG